MSQIGFTRLAATRVAAFVVVYALFGLLIPIQGSVTVSFAIGTVVTAVLYGLTLYYLNTNMPLGRRARFLITWLAVYVIQMLMPVLEGVFFSTQFAGAPELVFGALIFGWILVLPTALAGTLLFRPTDAIRGFGEMRKEYFARMNAQQFAGRYVVSSAMWMVIYFVFGSIVAPFVLPYYTAGGVGYELVVPELHVILVLQLTRGFILVLMILPLIMSINLDWKHLAIVLAALLYVGGAVAIFLISDQFPLVLRMFHGVEMLADASVAGVVIAYILGKK
ncbi:MAG: hypothetical protein ACFFB7_02815 [Candidatus Sifarchaeia archaeon]